MSDEQTLLAVLALIYLADCVYWIPRHAIGLTGWLGGPWHVRSGSPWLGNPRGSIALANPLPPLGTASRAQGWAISLSPAGVFSFVTVDFTSLGRPPQEGVFWRWDDIKKIERDEKKIYINKTLFFKAVTEYSARRVAQEIARLQKGGAKQSDIDAAIQKSCDVQAIRSRISEFKSVSGKLRLLGNFLFVFLFAVCPYLTWRYGMVAAIWPMVIGIYAQTIFIALVFSRAHRKVYPQDSAAILKPFLTMLLAAPSAIRAQDILARPLLEEFHPLAAMKALCAEDEFERVAPMIARDLKHPRLPVVPEGATKEAQETELFARETLWKALGLDEKTLLQVPIPTDREHALYCPRCLQQFTSKAQNCADCGGRELAPL